MHGMGASARGWQRNALFAAHVLEGFLQLENNHSLDSTSRGIVSEGDFVSRHIFSFDDASVMNAMTGGLIDFRAKFILLAEEQVTGNTIGGKVPRNMFSIGPQ